VFRKCCSIEVPFSTVDHSELPAGVVFGCSEVWGRTAISFPMVISARTATLPARVGVRAILAEGPNVFGRHIGHPPPRALHAAREGRGEQVSRRAEGRTRSAGMTKAQAPMTNGRKAESRVGLPSQTGGRTFLSAQMSPQFRTGSRRDAEAQRSQQSVWFPNSASPRHRAQSVCPRSANR